MFGMEYMEKNYLKRSDFWKRLSGSLLGCLLIGLGIAFLNTASFGNDPYSAMINSWGLLFSLTDIELFVKYPYLTGSIAFNLVAFVPMVIFMRKKINIGTVLNVFGCGYVVDLFCLLFGLLHWTTFELPLYGRIIFVVLGFLIECLGIAFFIQSDFGVAPYDAINLMVAKKITYKYARIVCDLACTLIAFIISVSVFSYKITSVGEFFKFMFIDSDDKIGWFTILLFVIGGPVVSFFGKLLNKYIFKSETANI